MNDELRSLGNARARGVALLLLVGIAGGAAGGAIDRWWTSRAGEERGLALRAEGRVDEPVSPTNPRRLVVRSEPKGDGEGEEIPFSLRSVKLTPEQIERVKAVTRRFRPEADSLMRVIRPRIIELNNRMQQEAMCVLTPDQRKEWMAWREREHFNLDEGKRMLELANSGRCPGDAAKK
jgi:hypothetical protein